MTVAKWIRGNVALPRWLMLSMALGLLGAVNGISATLPPGVTLYAATFGGGTFVSVGANGAIFSSVAGGPWEQRSSGTTNRLEAVGFGAGTFVAAGDHGTLVTSSNGVDWAVQSVNAVLTTPHVAFGNGRFVVGGKGGPNAWTFLVSSNSNALNWTTLSIDAPGANLLPDGLPFGGITFGAGRFLAVGGAQKAILFLTSGDGLTWTEQSGATPASVRPGPISYGNGVFALVENFYYEDDDDDGGFYDRLLISEDGETWQDLFLWQTDWTGLAVGDCRFVLSGTNQGSLSTSFFASDRGDSVNSLLFEVTNTIHGLVYGDGRFFAVGDDILELPLPDASPFIPVSQSNYTIDADTSGYLFFSAGLSCLEPPVQYQWRHNGVDIPGATNRYLTIGPTLGTNAAGNYWIVASNGAGLNATSAMAAITVTVNTPSNAPPRLAYPQTPITHSVRLGNDTYINALFSGWPRPSYQWRFNGNILPGATNDWMLLVNVNPANEGVYTLHASNTFGVATSPDIRLFILQEAFNFQTQTQHVSALEGSRFDFAPYDSNPLFYTYWLARSEFHVLRNGVGERIPLAPNLHAIIRQTSLADAGTYLFVLSNAFGASTSHVFHLSVTPGGPLDRWTQRNPLPQNDTLFSVAYGNGAFVAVGDRGSIVRSTNSIDWAPIRLRSEALISGISFGNGTFVAVGGANILTSTDGIHWTTRVVRFDLALQSVLFANGRFIAAGGDIIVTSPDGVTWTDATLPAATNREFRDLAFGNGVFVAVGYYPGFPSIWLPASGTTWAPLSNGPWDELESVTFGNGQFVAVGNNGSIYSSPNGSTWTARDSTVSSRLLSVAYGNGNFVAVGTRGRVLTSADGINWTRQTSGTPDRLEGVKFVNDRFVAVGENGTLITSMFGTAWVKRNQGTTRDLDGMTQGAGLLVVAGKGGTILTSSNGIDFIPQNSGVTNDLHGVGWGDGLFVAVGEPEIILTSSNAVQWQLRHSGTTSSLKNVRRGGNLWVAVGTGGTILTSPDGITWTPRVSTTANDLNDVTFGQGRFVIVGDGLPPNGTMLVSSDGITWTRRHQYIGKNLRSVSFVNGAFIATGNDAHFLLSSNGLDWEWRTTGIFPAFEEVSRNLRAATHAAGTWLMVGNGGMILTSTNGVNWAQRANPWTENLHAVSYFRGRFVTIGNRGTILQSDSVATAWLSGRFTPTGFDLSFRGEVGIPYQLQSSASLAVPDWTSIRSFTLLKENTNILDASSLTNSQRFYRVITP